MLTFKNKIVPKVKETEVKFFKTNKELLLHKEDKLRRIREFEAQMPTHMVIPIHPTLYAQESIILGLLQANIRNPSIMGKATKMSRVSITKILGYMQSKDLVFKQGKNIWFKVGEMTHDEAVQHAKNYYKSARNPKGVLGTVCDSVYDKPAAEFVENARKDAKWVATGTLPKDKTIDLGIKRGKAKPKEQRDSRNQGSKLWHELLNDDTKLI